VAALTGDEAAVLWRVRNGIRVAELAASFGAKPDRLTGALFALLSRGSVVLSPARAPATLELVEEGRAHFAAGRVALAVARFREALLLAPEDAEAREELGAILRLA
jgi:Flp pilus assembly protein TadD